MRTADVAVKLQPRSEADAAGAWERCMQIPVEHCRREHQLVHDGGAANDAPHLETFQLLINRSRTLDSSNIDQGLYGECFGNLPQRLLLRGQVGEGAIRKVLRVLPPPNLRQAPQDAVYLLQIRRSPEARESLLQATDDATIREADGVDELHAQYLRQRKVLTEEEPDLHGVHRATLQEANEVHGVVPDAACRHQERQTSTGLLVENRPADR
mmetsp:Transcript_30335/g.77572  ORF Transcript_30335/g.77572 Transcript_30335/m.77572 type:complete len:212 (-) Transcript_30335:797-1432(-)